MPRVQWMDAKDYDTPEMFWKFFFIFNHFCGKRVPKYIGSKKIQDDKTV